MARSAASPAPTVLGSVRGILFGVAVFSTFVNILTLTVPLYMMQAYDRVLNSGSIATLSMLTLVAVGCLAAFAGFEVIRTRLMSRASTRLEYEVGPLVLESAILAATRRGGVRSAQPMRDLQEVRTFLTSPGFLALMDAPWVPFYLLVLFFMHPALAAIATVGSVVLASLGVLGETVGKKPMRAARDASVAAGRKAQAFVQNADIVRAMGMTPALKQRWITDVDDAFVTMTAAADRAGALAAAAKLVRLLLQIAVIGGGVILVLAHELTSGVLVAASLLTARALAPLEQSLAAWRGLVSTREAMARIREGLAMLPAPGRWLPEPEGHLQVEDVSLLVPGASRPILHGVSFRVGPGEVLGVIGPSGAGKSTLARVLVGLERPTRGRVRLDGVDLAAWSADQLGTYVGYLPQNAGLLSGTVAENIAGMAADGDPWAIKEAAMQSGAHDVIVDLPGGYAADVGNDGESLSVGQRQRIGLARAFYGPRKLLVLDEPNSNLDASGDAALAGAITTARRRKCATIIVTHRPEILRSVDAILSLSGGVVVRYGQPRLLPVDQLQQASEERRVAAKVSASSAAARGDGRRLREAPPAARNSRSAIQENAPPIPRRGAPGPVSAENADSQAFGSKHSAEDAPGFLITHAAADRDIAEAVARVLELMSGKSVLRSIDVATAAGVAELDRALATSARAVAIVTSDYLEDRRCAEVRRRVLDGDPLDARERLVLLRADDCEPGGLLSAHDSWSLLEARAGSETLESILQTALLVPSEKQRATAAPFHRPGRRLLAPRVGPVLGFRGRKAELLAVDAALWDGNDAMVAIVGPMGAGKAVIASEYAWQAREGFAGTWWLDASSDREAERSEGMRRGLREFAAFLGLPCDGNAAIDESVFAFLARGFAKPWLVVLENVESASVLAAWKPRGNVRTLITTMVADAVGGLARIDAGRLQPGDAAALVLAESGRGDLDALAASAIADVLEYLPLPLVLAAAWLRSSPGETPSRYLEAIRQRKAASQYSPLGRAVEAAVLEQIVRAEALMPGAASMIEVAAFLAPDSVTERLFAMDPALYPEPLQPIASDAGRRASTFATLVSLSLLTPVPSQQTFRMHRLTQSVVRRSLGPQRGAVARRALNIAMAVVPPESDEPLPLSRVLAAADPRRQRGQTSAPSARSGIRKARTA